MKSVALVASILIFPLSSFAGFTTKSDSEIVTYYFTTHYLTPSAEESQDVTFWTRVNRAGKRIIGHLQHEHPTRAYGDRNEQQAHERFLADVDDLARKFSSDLCVAQQMDDKPWNRPNANSSDDLGDFAALTKVELSAGGLLVLGTTVLDSWRTKQLQVPSLIPVWAVIGGMFAINVVYNDYRSNRYDVIVLDRTGADPRITLERAILGELEDDDVRDVRQVLSRYPKIRWHD